LSDVVEKPTGGSFSSDLKLGTTTWCPYCGGVKGFVWDTDAFTSRYPNCGVSTEDSYVCVCSSGPVKGGRASTRVSASTPP
jgi:hypothetical protein